MANALRTLSALALLAVLTPFASAQDCARVPLSAGTAAAYSDCAQSTPAPVVSGPNDFSFGHNGSENQFVRFQQNNPGTLINVAPYTPPVFLGAGDFLGNDFTQWLGLDSGNLAISVNANTGAVSNLGNIVPSAGGQWTGLTYDYQDSQFYATASSCGVSSQLYLVNFTTLTATLRGNIPDATCAISIASDPTTGVLYVHDIVADQVVTVNKANGASTILGPTGFDANFGQAMDFDNDSGVLYMYAFNSGTFVAELRTVNTTSGATALVGPIGVGLQQIGAGSSQTELTGGGGCDVSFNSVSITPLTTSPGATVTISGSLNNAGSTRTVRLVLDYDQQGGPQDGSITLGSGMLTSGNSPFSTSAVVPGCATDSSYDVDVRVVDVASGSTCDTAPFVVTVTVPASASRVGTDGPDGFEATPVDFSASVTASTQEATASPNPFAGQTAIRFALDATADVRLAVYDVLGREVAVLVDGMLDAGTHTATFDARGLSAGTYVYRLVTGASVQTGRMTLAH